VKVLRTTAKVPRNVEEMFRTIEMMFRMVGESDRLIKNDLWLLWDCYFITKKPLKFNGFLVMYHLL